MPCASWVNLWRKICVVMLFGMALQIAAASERDVVVEQAWLEDPTGRLTWDEVQKMEPKPFRDALSAGYGAAPIWVRLRIDPAAANLAPDDKLLMRIRPSYLNEIVLHDPLQPDATSLPLGDLYPVTNQLEPSTAYLYGIPAGSAPRDLWLRIQTTSARLVYVEVMTPKAYSLSNAKIALFGSLYLALITLFALWGLVHVLFRPEPLMSSFLFYQVASLMLGICFWGYAYLYLSDILVPGQVDKLTNYLIVIMTFSAILFSHFLLDEMRPSHWRSAVMRGILFLFPMLLIMLATGHTSLALKANIVLVLLVPLIMWALAILSKCGIPNDRRRKHRGLSKAIVVGYFTLTVAFPMLTAAPALGLIQGGEISIYIAFLYSTSSGVLMILMLQYRAWMNVRQTSDLKAMAHEAAAHAAYEKSNRLERDNLLAMLGHELKTPLATMRMVLADEQIPHNLSRKLVTSVADMAMVVERTVQTDQLEHGVMSVHLESCVIDEVLTTLCHDLPDAERIERLTTGHAADDRPVLTDRYLLSVIVRNLLDNALKYSALGSTVLLERSTPDAQGQWSLTVSNRAGRAGLPDCRLFEKYYRSPKASHRTGSGLGLYMVQGLAKLLNATLTYEHDGEWIKFRLQLKPHALERNQ